MRVEGSDIYFFQDVPDTFNGGVKRPASWSIQYWDGDRFVDVANPSGYPTQLNQYNGTGFDEVTTSRLRATLQSQTFSGAGGVGVLEWKVYAVQPAKTRAFHVPTVVGQQPDLPDAATLIYDDGSRLDAGLRWKRFDPELLQAADTSFPVEGVADGSLETVAGTVYVRGTANVRVKWLEDEEVLVLQGVAPSLPSTVTALYEDGSRDNVHTDVEWADADPARFGDRGTETVTGQERLTSLVARANVTTCSEIIRGDYEGSVTVSGGLTCLEDASVDGDVAVEPGAGLVAVDSSISGSLTANKATVLRLVGTQVAESVTVTKGSGRVDVTRSAVAGPLNLVGNRTASAPLVADNDLGGALNCQQNDPAPVHDGRPNRVASRALGQCATLAGRR